MPDRAVEKHPSLKTILQIADALDTTVDDLLADVQKKKKTALENEQDRLLSGCTEKQKRFMLSIWRKIKEEMINYEN